LLKNGAKVRLYVGFIATLGGHEDLIKKLHKPRELDKLFTGLLVREERDFVAIGYRPADVKVWCSEPVESVKKARCFIRYGRILDVRHYKGNWRRTLDHRARWFQLMRGVDPCNF
jgi:hypothetical protein